ncbi:MAG TPA: tripartite tricarboxylate transporter substrate binding protein [Burkholderiales bacterium]|nr:tripartite tricarboxylate transporter substrate binding protein [Burkholderiales bacterium]
MKLLWRLSGAVCALAYAAVAAVTLGLAAVDDAAAQKWPDRSVRIVTPFAAGGGTDVFARILAQRLSEVLGQQFIVDNRPGAGSTMGTEFVARAPADGYTFLMTSASFSFNPGLYPKLRYDSIKDFTPVSLVVRVPHVIVVLPSLPVRTLLDLVKIARAKPGAVLYASSGPGSAMHLAGALFGVITQTQITHVPYKGGPATATAVMSGEATTAFNTIETVLPLIRGKRLRPLAVSTRERTPALPEVPTAIEAGIRDYEVVGWFGLLAPAATPPAIVEQLSSEVAKAMSSPAIRERALQEGAAPVGSTPAEFDRFVRDEIAKWNRIIKQAGITLE